MAQKIEDRNHSNPNERISNRSKDISGFVRRVLRGRLPGALLAALVTTSGAMDAAKAYSPDNVPQGAVSTEKAKDLDLPDEVTVRKGALLQIEPMHPTVDEDIKVLENTSYKVDGYNLGRYIVVNEGQKYWVYENDVIEEENPIQEQENTATYVVISTDNARVRTEPDTTKNNVIYFASAGEELEVSGEVVTIEGAADDRDNWYPVVITTGTQPDEEKKGWVNELVISKVITKAKIADSTGVGGGGGEIPPATQEITATQKITQTQTVSDTEAISATEVISAEISPAHRTMDQILPENVIQYYEAIGGKITWNDILQVYEVSFKNEVGEKKFVLLPQTGAQLTDEADLAEGLYYLGDTASLSVESIVDGKPVSQSFHFVVSPNFPKFEGHDFLPSLPDSINEVPEITISTTNAEQRKEIAKSLVKLFGFDETKSFNHFVVFAGETMEVVDTSVDKSRQVRGLFEDGNDHEVNSYTYTNPDANTQTYATVYYPERNVLAEHYLLNPEFKDYFGSGIFWQAFERISMESAWRPNSEGKLYLDLEAWVKFYLDTFAQKIFDITKELSDLAGGRYTPVFDIKISEKIIGDYVKTLTSN